MEANDEQASKSRGQRLQAAALRDVLQAAEGKQYATLIRFAIATGLRRGETLGLRWQDVDIDRGMLEVRQSVQYVKGEGFRAPPPKSKNSRRAAELSAALRRPAGDAPSRAGTPSTSAWVTCGTTRTSCSPGRWAGLNGNRRCSAATARSSSPRRSRSPRA